MGMYSFAWETELNGLTPIAWHGHEMIFGYALAVIAGFLLTAVKNWTGIQTLQAYKLCLLFLLWATARILPFAGTGISVWLMAIVDNLFIALLFLSTAIPIIRARKWRQLPILLILLLMLSSNIGFYAGIIVDRPELQSRGLYAGFYLVVTLIMILGGRVIPSFIRNAIEYPIRVRTWLWIDVSSVLLFLPFWLVDVFFTNTVFVTSLALILFILHSIRMIGWYTVEIWKIPLLWVLYLAYGFLVVGFLLKFSVSFFGISAFLALHAFAYGGVGMISIGMMCRVATGHTGRDVQKPSALLFWVFVVLFTGAIFRVICPIIAPQHYAIWIAASQVLWIISFSMFLYIFTPILVQPRIDGQHG